jgi:3''-phosphoadenosine 5''-phosphosulfate sulfotransferase (PAPS reductase)/FAD synthetase and related enzymes
MTQETLFRLEQHIRRHHKPVIWASGGKDSLTLLHLCRPWAKRLQVIHNAVDMGWPLVTENLLTNLEEWGYAYPEIVHPPRSLPDYIRTYGWPVEVVPSAMDRALPTPFSPGKPRVSSYWQCTMIRQLLPMAVATKKLEADAVLTGCKAVDAPLFDQIGPMVNGAQIGWIRYDDLHAWTDKQVWEYVDEHEISLPPHYRWKRYAVWNVPDCTLCTWDPRTGGCCVLNIPRCMPNTGRKWRRCMTRCARNSNRRWEP